MPQVPVYGERQVRLAPLQPVTQVTPDVSSGAQALAQGMGQVAEVADRRVMRDAETEAWTAQAKIADEFDKWDTTERKRSQGANARDYRAKVDAWWAETQKNYTGALSPLAQRAIGKSLAAVRNGALRSAGDYETQQLELGVRSALDRSVNELVKQAIKAGPDGGAPILSSAADQVRSFYTERGLDGNAAALKVTTGAHTTVINQLMQRDPKAAERYFNTHKDQIEPTSWDEIGSKLNQSSALNDGEGVAKRVWDENVRQGDYRNPVDLFKLERLAREEFPNDPARRNAAIGEIRSRFQAWNQTQTEVAAGNIEAVYRMLGNGTRLTPRILNSPEWDGLPSRQRREIETQLEQQNAARESRLMVAEGRELQRLQRAQATALLTNADQYLAMSDPAKLATMSRNEVRATLSIFGMQGTQQLLERWDALQKPGKVAEARMDQDDFNAIADRMGLKPFDPRKSENERRDLGTLKFRIEQMIDLAQRNSGRPLTREEKNLLMREEMARTVTVDPGPFSRERQVPVIAMTPQQIRQVVIPPAEMSKVVEALRYMNRLHPTDPRYFSTPENMRREYLDLQSKAARLIGPEPR